MTERKEKVRVCCFGYNGVNNTGSEAKLRSTLKTITDVLGERLGELAVLTFNEKNQRRYLTDYPAIRYIEIGPWMLLKNPKLLIEEGYDIFVLSEGSTFIDHFSSLFLYMFCGAARLEKRRGHKVVAYANDCGHLKPFNQKVVKRTLNKVDLIMLRNPDAAARMKEYGVTHPLTVTADGAYEYPMPSKEYQEALFKKLKINPKGKPIIGIAPKEFFWWPIKFRPWGPKEDLYLYPFYHSWPAGGKESSARYVAQSARHADWCVETYAADIAMISMEHMDYPPCVRIRDAMKHKDRVIMVPSDEYIVDDIISVLSVLSGLVTTRYHAVVLSSCSAIPMIAVSSDTRCEAVFRELDMMDLFIDYVKHPAPVPKVLDLDEQLIEMTRTMMDKRGELKKRIAQAHPRFVERAQQNQIIFMQWFNENFPAPGA